MIYSSICIILLVISLYYISKNLGANTVNNKKCFGQKKENIATLISRTVWANYNYNRTFLSARYLFFSLVLAFFGSIIFEKKCDEKNIFLCTIVFWVVLSYGFGFMRYHADQYSAYFINKNLEKIRKKLNLPVIPFHKLKITKKRFNSNSSVYLHDSTYSQNKPK